MALETFPLSTCQRIAACLGDKTPETDLFWYQEQDMDSGYKNVGDPFPCCDSCIEEFHIGKRLCAAFTISDLTGEVWQALGEKLGWNGEAGLTNAYSWKGRAVKCYKTWLTGGYEAAEAYLDTILPK